MPASWPRFSPDEIAAVTQTLQSGKVNYWTGNECQHFEQEFARYFGVKHAIALMNGTVALEAALYALDIGPGDDVMVTCRTFVASASAVVLRGATPIMVDVDLHSQNITVETIQAAMTPNTKAIICVHLAGWPCDMPAIMAFAKAHNLYVIEDCAQSHGAKINGQYAGSFGHVNAFSFCQDKIMTTGGEGGMVVTNDETLWKKMWSYKDHGKDYDAVYHKQHPPGFRWLHENFGTNWRMTEMQAAIGRLQLLKLAGWIERRNHFAMLLNQAFASIDGLRVTIPPTHITHAYYKYYVFISPARMPDGLTRDAIMAEMHARGIACFNGSCSEIYLENCFTKNNLGPKARLENAKQLGENSLMFLVHPTLTDRDIDTIIDAMQSIMGISVDVT